MNRKVLCQKKVKTCHFFSKNPHTEAPDRVKVGTTCKLICKPGHIWFPEEDNFWKDGDFDEIKCLGQFSRFGFGNWDFISDEIFEYKWGGVGDINLRICVPQNYLEKDEENFQIGAHFFP